MKSLHDLPYLIRMDPALTPGGYHERNLLSDLTERNLSDREGNERVQSCIANAGIVLRWLIIHCGSPCQRLS